MAHHARASHDMPTKYTPEVHKAIVESLRKGNHRTTAAACGRINDETIRNWVSRGETGEEPFAAFARDVADAERESETTLVGIVRNTANEDWHAAAWILARRHPDRWGQTNKTELTGANGGPVQTVDVTKLTDAELAAIVAGPGTGQKGSGRT